MKKSIFTLIFIALIGFSFAGNEGENPNATNVPVQTIELSGQVIDLNSGEALVGVEVNIEGSDQKAYTDFDGNFKFKNVKPGNYSLIASYISYKKSLVENFSANSENSEINIKLEESN